MMQFSVDVLIKSYDFAQNITAHHNACYCNEYAPMPNAIAVVGTLLLTVNCSASRAVGFNVRGPGI